MFFLSALLYALTKERTMLIVHLRSEVKNGFIEAEELMGFRTLFGRERYVLGGRAHGTYGLRKELRRAQLALAFRKWHLKHGAAPVGGDVDGVLYSCRLRIRDARNAINAAEGVVETRKSVTVEHPATNG